LAAVLSPEQPLSSLALPSQNYYQQRHQSLPIQREDNEDFCPQLASKPLVKPFSALAETATENSDYT
jgi:hypothetical protein